MKRISSNSLLHFTSNIDNLISILENDFSPRICIEKLTPFTRSEVAIPMVCFCDIPLSQIELHSKQYGSYGLGLTKEWGKKNGISPVMYFHSNANHISPFMKSMKKVEKSNVNMSDYSKVMYTTWFYKPYEGKMWRGKAYTKKRIRFYDEKEWRFIPKFEDFEDNYTGPWSYYDQEVEKIKNDEMFKRSINEGLSRSFKLRFEPKDIKYIIVKNEIEILEMTRKIRRLKGKFSLDDVEVLCTRVVSMESIRTDF